jgi:hypothetical protein
MPGHGSLAAVGLDAKRVSPEEPIWSRVKAVGLATGVAPAGCGGGQSDTAGDPASRATLRLGTPDEPARATSDFATLASSAAGVDECAAFVESRTVASDTTATSRLSRERSRLRADGGRNVHDAGPVVGAHAR